MWGTLFTAFSGTGLLTVLWVHRKLPQSTVKQVLPSNESYESRTGCNCTLATVLWVPLMNFRIRLPLSTGGRLP